MKEIHYDAEGDILTVNFLKTTAEKPRIEKRVGFEIARNIVFYFDTVNEKPLEMIVISYSRLVKYTCPNPLPLKKLSKHPKRLQRLVHKVLQQAPVSNFLELKASNKGASHTVCVKTLVLEPKLLEETV
jgi:hypothetical protein